MGPGVRGAGPPGLDAQHGEDALDYPYICDTRTFTGNLEDCHEFQVERVSGGNPELDLDDSESFSLGAVLDVGFISLTADWFQIEVTDMPARLAAQSVIDLEVKGQLPDDITVVRQGGRVTQIQSTRTNSGDVKTAGFDVRARTDWKFDWASLSVDVNWLHVTQGRTRVGDETQPGSRPHNRVHVLFSVSRGNSHC